MIVDGGPGLEAGLVALWGDDLLIQRCTVYKHRDLLFMIYAETATGIEKRRKALPRANGA